MKIQNEPASVPEFKLSISCASKWDQGYLKVISYGYTESIDKGIIGYFQKKSDRNSKSTYGDIDLECAHSESVLRQSDIEPILGKLSKTFCRLTGPEEATQYIGSIHNLSVSMNHHSTSISWNALNCDYDKPYQEIWGQIDALISPDEQTHFEALHER